MSYKPSPPDCSQLPSCSRQGQQGQDRAPRTRPTPYDRPGFSHHSRSSLSRQDSDTRQSCTYQTTCQNPSPTPGYQYPIPSCSYQTASSSGQRTFSGTPDIPSCSYQTRTPITRQDSNPRPSCRFQSTSQSADSPSSSYHSPQPSCSYQRPSTSSTTSTPLSSPRLLRPGTINFPGSIAPSPADASCSSSADLQSLIPRLNPLTPTGYPPSGFMPGQPPHHYGYDPHGLNAIMPKKAGGRRPKEFDYPEMEDGEDFDKRMKRRQRNKEAAARCRQRRLELMQALQEQVDKHRQENLQKESQLRELRAQFERMQQFLHNHDCKLSQEERQAQMNMGLPPSSQYQLQNIPPHTQAPQTSLPSMNSSGGALQPSQAHLNTQSSEFRHILPDYNPQVSMGNDRKRHHQNIQPLPSAEEGFGPTVLKQPKPEPTLAALNNPMDVERPTNLFVSSSQSFQGNASMPLTTPSNGIGTPYQPINTAFGGNFFTPGPGGDLLNGPTGLTPLTNNPVAVFPTSNSGSTPVETGERELRRL